MSRSKRKISRIGITNASSEKKDKRLANRAFRKKAKQMLRAGYVDELPEDLREISSIWSWDKDGKQYFDKEEHPELMRK